MINLSYKGGRDEAGTPLGGVRGGDVRCLMGRPGGLRD